MQEPAAIQRRQPTPFVIAGAIGACIGLLVTAVFAVMALARSQEDAAARPLVDVVTVAAGPVRSELLYAGVVQAPQQATLTALTAGTLTAVHADIGASVRAGERIASLGTEALPAQLVQAQADLAAAEARRALVRAGARASDIDSARAVLTAAEAKLAQLTQPSAADVATARSALANAQSSLASSEAAIESTRALLYGAIANACSTPLGPGIPVPCGGTDVPLPSEVVDALGGFLQSRAGDARTDLGARTTAVLSANVNYRNALATVSAAREAATTARVKLDALLNPTTADLAAQRAQVEVARNTLETRLTPYTDADVKAANAGVARAQAQIAATEASIARAAIVAPFDGVVAQRLVDPGANVTPQTPIVLLVSKGALVNVTLRDTDAAGLKPGGAVEVTGPAARTPLKGRVSSVAPIGDPRAHTVEVKVTADGADDTLRPGTLVQVRLIAAEKQGVLAVPPGAILLEDQAMQVFVVVDGQARAREVTTGLAGRSAVEVTKGLNPGDVVIVRGQSGLRDGQRVRTTPLERP